MHNIIRDKMMRAKRNKDLELMKVLYENNRNNLQISLEYAKLLIEKNKKEEAREILIDLLNTQIDNCAMLELGRLEKQDGNIALARKYFNELLKFQDDKTCVMLELGKLEKEQGNFSIARKYFKSLLNSTNNARAILELGKLEKMDGNIESARKYFNKLLDNKNSVEYAMLELGILENEIGNIEETREYFIKTLNEASDKSYVLPLLILLEIQEHNYSAAFDYINFAIKQNITIESNLILYISRKLNVFFDIDYTKMKYNYSLNQLLEYDEYIAMEHILERHIEGDSLVNFNKNEDVYKLFNNIKECLNEKNKLRHLVFNDRYIVKKKNVGRDGQNAVLVVTLPESKDIITMYPVKNKKNINRYLKEINDGAEKVLIKK